MRSEDLFSLIVNTMNYDISNNIILFDCREKQSIYNLGRYLTIVLLKCLLATERGSSCH